MIGANRSTLAAVLSDEADRTRPRLGITPEHQSLLVAAALTFSTNY